MISTAATEGADAIILDLEDGCPIAEKETGRIFARDSILFLKENRIDVFVRVNSIETGLTQIDLQYIITSGLDGIVLAKTETEEDVRKTDQWIRQEEEKKGLVTGEITLIPLIETPMGLLNLQSIVGASSRIEAIGFGAGDFSREMGAGMGVTKLSPEEYFSMILFARSTIAVVARAHGIEAIDSPFFGLVIDLEGLKRESEKVRLLGFSGKQVIHPRHVTPVNEVFTPGKEEIDFARKVVMAYEEAKSKGLGATSLGGKMIDYGSYKRAKSLLAYFQLLEKKERKMD
jgi:citrate lyase subunit beta/citryl-CoA lyase